jgi:triosephosphate isomerase
MGESDEVINKKVINAIAHGIRPILCVGETLAHREAGQTIDILTAQLDTNLAGVDSTMVDVAYEPLRSIGTGKIPTNDEIAQVHAFIRSKTSPVSRILYG